MSKLLMNDSNIPLIIFGAGGHAKVLINSLTESSRDIKGIIDPKIDGEIFFDIPVMNEKKFIEEYQNKNIQIVNGLGNMPGKNYRKSLAKKLRNIGFIFATIIDNKAYIASDAEVNEGVQIMAGVIIQPGVEIGKDTIINTSASIDHDCRIGENCHIAPGVTMSGNVVVGDECHIGTGTVILNDIIIEKNSIIAAGSTVYRNLSPNSKLIQKK